MPESGAEVWRWGGSIAKAAHFSNCRISAGVGLAEQLSHQSSTAVRGPGQLIRHRDAPGQHGITAAHLDQFDPPVPD